MMFKKILIGNKMNENELDIEQLKFQINSRLSNKPIVLVGMMGVGISVICKLLAKSLDREFTDLDKNVEKKLNLKIHEIFEKFGENKFRELEYEEIKKLKINDNNVIATGGGAFIFSRNSKLIKEKSLSVWIKASKDIIFKRVNSNNNRPLLKNKNLSNKINNLLQERNPLYAKAHIHVESKNETKLIMKNKLLLSINNYLEYENYE